MPWAARSVATRSSWPVTARATTSARAASAASPRSIAASVPSRAADPPRRRASDQPVVRSASWANRTSGVTSVSCVPLPRHRRRAIPSDVGVRTRTRPAVGARSSSPAMTGTCWEAGRSAMTRAPAPSPVEPAAAAAQVPPTRTGTRTATRPTPTVLRWRQPKE